MTIPFKQPVIADAPRLYDPLYVNDLARSLRTAFAQIGNPGHVQATTLTLTELPTSAAGLSSGSIWVDTGAGNVLKIVP